MNMEKGVKDIMQQLKEEGSIFRFFTDADIEQTYPYFSVFEFYKGVTISDPGESIDIMGIIVSGEVMLEEEHEFKGNWLVLSRLSRGAILTNPELFGLKPPPVRVIAQQDTTIIGIRGKSFDSFLENHPDIGVKFLKEMIRVILIRFSSLLDRFNVVF